MNINFKNSQNNNMLTRYKKLDDIKNSAVKTQNKVQEKPADAISFGGLSLPVANKSLNKVINFVSENEAAYNAIYSLVIAGMLKPMFVLNMPGSEDKDKQIVATKNFLQAFIGSFLGFTVGGGFVKKIFDVIKSNLKLITLDNGKVDVVAADSKTAIEVATDALKKESKGFGLKLKNASSAMKNADNGNKIGVFVSNLFKKVKFDPTTEESQQLIKEKAKYLVENCKKNHVGIFQKDTKFLSEILNKSYVHKGAKSSMYEAFESFWKNSTGFITTIGKAKISGLLLPSVMAALFAKKNLEKQLEKQRNASMLMTSKNFQEENNRFKALISNNSKVNFKGSVLDKVIDKTAQAVEAISVTKPGQVPVKLLTKSKHPSARMGDFESVMLTAYWVRNTKKSKKIDPDQKLGLNVHTVLVTLVSSTMAAIIDGLSDKLIDNTSLKYKNAILNSVQKAQKNPDAKEGIKQLAQECSKLFNSEGIMKSIVNKNGEILKGAELEQAVKTVTKGYAKKLSKFKSLTLFTFVVRFLVPVLMVPISGKMKKKIVELTSKKKDEKNVA